MMPVILALICGIATIPVALEYKKIRKENEKIN